MSAVSARLISQDGTPWYLTISTTGILSLGEARPGGEVFFEGQAVYWFLLTSPDGRPWYVSPSETGELRADDERPALGDGWPNVLPLRDVSSALWFVFVTVTGVVWTSLDQTVFDDEQPLFYCWRHGLAYRADTRIYPLSTTHCPIDNSPLVSWTDFVNGREGDFDPPGEYFEEAYS